MEEFIYFCFSVLLEFIIRGWLCGRVVKFVHSALAAQGFAGSESWAWTRHHSTSHAEVASHISQLEGPTTTIHNDVVGGFGMKKKKNKDWQQMLAQVPILKKRKEKNFFYESLTKPEEGKYLTPARAGLPCGGGETPNSCPL